MNLKLKNRASGEAAGFRGDTAGDVRIAAARSRSYRRRTRMGPCWVTMLVSFFVGFALASCTGAGSPRARPSIGQVAPVHTEGAPADGLVSDQRAEMAVEDQQRAETALEGDRTPEEVRDHRDSPLRPPPRWGTSREARPALLEHR